jgi:hypothetical protein
MQAPESFSVVDCDGLAYALLAMQVLHVYKVPVTTGLSGPVDQVSKAGKPKGLQGLDDGLDQSLGQLLGGSLGLNHGCQALHQRWWDVSHTIGHANLKTAVLDTGDALPEASRGQHKVTDFPWLAAQHATGYAPLHAGG